MNRNKMNTGHLSKAQLIELCIDKGLPASNDDDEHTLRSYLTVANSVDGDFEIDESLFVELKQTKEEPKSKSFLGRILSFF